MRIPDISFKSSMRFVGFYKHKENVYGITEKKEIYQIDKEGNLTLIKGIVH